MLKRIGIIAISLAICTIASRAVERTKRIDGYEEYKFGMTLDQAKRVQHQGAESTKCDYVGVAACIEYSTTVGAFPATVTAQFTGTPPLLRQILLTFRATDDPIQHSCTDVAKELIKLLVDKYGEKPFVRPHHITWTSPDGGSVELTSLCFGSEKGINIVSYKPSNPL